MRVRFAPIVALLGFLLACGGDTSRLGPPDPLPGETLPEGALEGTLRAASSGTPIAGALVELEPGSLSTVSDGAGAFRFEGLPVGEGPAVYSLRATKDGFAALVTQTTLSAGTATRSMTLEMAPVPPRPTSRSGPLSVEIHLSPPPGGEGVLTYTLKVENRSSEPLTGLTVRDSIEDAFQHRLTRADVDLNAERFPDGRVTVDPDGLVFTVDVDALAPTTEPVDLVRFRVPIPPGGEFGVFIGEIGIACTYADASATLEEELVANDDTLCVIL